jgi:hypothetical protein
MRTEVSRDIRISTEAAEAMGPARAQALRAGPEPRQYECVICAEQGDVGNEPTSILVYRYTQLINIVFAHAACSPSLVEQRGELDVANVYRTHVTPVLIGDLDSGGWPVLVIEPLYPVDIAGPGGAYGTNSHVSTWLREGLVLMAALEIPPPALTGWRVVLVPGDHDDQVRVTVQCRVGFPDGPATIADDAPVRPGTPWMAEMRERRQVIVYAGLTDLLDIREKTAENVAMALAAACHGGRLTGGLIEAASIEL